LYDQKGIEHTFADFSWPGHKLTDGTSDQLHLCDRKYYNDFVWPLVTDDFEKPYPELYSFNSTHDYVFGHFRQRSNCVKGHCNSDKFNYVGGFIALLSLDFISSVFPIEDQLCSFDGRSRFCLRTAYAGFEPKAIGCGDWRHFLIAHYLKVFLLLVIFAIWVSGWMLKRRKEDMERHLDKRRSDQIPTIRDGESTLSFAREALRQSK